jgi:hypothetical protein
MKRTIGRAGAVWVILATLAGGTACAQDTTKQNEPRQITLDQVASQSKELAGKEVTVTGTVASVLGPRLFTMNSGKWIDFHGDTVVITPAPLAALVNKGDAITVTGVVKPLVETTVDREWGWFSDDPTITTESKMQSGIVAQTITTMKDKGRVVLTIDTTRLPQTGVMTDLAELARANDTRMVGRWVDVQSARVESMTKEGGFWVTEGGDRVYVFPKSFDTTKLVPGRNVQLQGVVLVLPDRIKSQLGSNAANEQIYLYATQVGAGS